MSEYQIECKVERMVDALDRAYMAGELSDEEYRSRMESIDAWAESQYAGMSGK